MILTRWITNWRRRTSPPTGMAYGLNSNELEALRILRASPQWAHYATLLERIGEQQASELVSGLAHDRYLFASGALTALRRVFTLVDDLLVSASKLEEITDARNRTAAEHAARASRAFLNTPWYDGWKRDRAG